MVMATLRRLIGRFRGWLRGGSAAALSREAEEHRRKYQQGGPDWM
jgi:hypothetical protein